MGTTEFWLQALRERGAQIEAGRVAGFRDSRQSVSPSSTALVPLLGESVLTVEGDDAADFLQGQLTNDMSSLGATRALPTAYCTAKGRVIATLLLWPSAAGICIELSTDLSEAVLKRLRMYVLRARAVLSDASSRKALLGVAGSSAMAVLEQQLGLSVRKPYDCASRDAVTAIALPGERVLLAIDVDAAPAVWDALAPACTASGDADWARHTIAAGVPTITLPTSDAFTPQMLNLELLGAVSFAKGCYTGQEIVARTEHLGQVKRRLLRFGCSDEVAPGQPVFAEGNQVGTVINAAPLSAGDFELLAVVSTQSARARLRASDPDGPALKLLAVPYSIPELSGVTGDVG
jgi:folate-binding protein YgfZ